MRKNKTHETPDAPSFLLSPGKIAATTPLPARTLVNPPAPTSPAYIGRLAPSPTGLLHLGHAQTFWIAAERARAAQGTLLLRNDDLDRERCRAEFVDAMREDLRWLGLDWREPMFTQSERLPLYRAALAQLHAAGHIFPCNKSRRDVLSAASAPHEGSGVTSTPADDEPVYPREFRPPADAPLLPLPPLGQPITANWRFRVSDDELLSFTDLACGPQHAVAGRDFGDFLVWRKDNLPSYQLACAVDDALLGITEVVRGADLIRSTFRQLLLFRALGKTPPAYYHCPLVLDANGQRLAKRHDALALRTLREQGVSPNELLARFRQNLSASPFVP